MTPPAVVTFSEPADSTVNACNYDDFAQLQTEFQGWVTEQTAAIENSLAGGCDPQITDNSADPDSD
jgi:hypothetical protein